MWSSFALFEKLNTPILHLSLRVKKKSFLYTEPESNQILPSVINTVFLLLTKQGK